MDGAESSVSVKCTTNFLLDSTQLVKGLDGSRPRYFVTAV